MVSTWIVDEMLSKTSKQISPSLAWTSLDKTLILLLLLGTAVAAAESRQVTIVTTPEWEPLLSHAREQNFTKGVSVRLESIQLPKGNSAFDDIEHTYKKLRRISPQALIAPYDSALSLAAEDLKIPYICTTPVAKTTLNYTLQISPELKRTASAIMDVIWAFKWSKVSVMYDSDEGMHVVEKLMTNHTLTVRAWRLSPKPQRSVVRNSLVEMRKVLVDKTVIICNWENTDLLLDEARNLAMVSTPPHGWLFYDPGNEMTEIFNLYTDISVNFTIVSVLPFNSTMPNDVHSRYNYSLASDALALVVVSYKLLNTHAPASLGNPLTLRNELTRVIKSKSMEGMTGTLDFSECGKRTNYFLTLTTFNGSNYYARGRWHSLPVEESLHKQLLLYKEILYPNRSTPFPLKGRTVNVVMIEEKPFTMLKSNHMELKGNNKFEGFAVDLIQEIATMLSFDYTIYLVSDGKFGSKMPNGEWNGMIGELLSGNATMSVASLSINAQREEAVDFTKPFKTRYISVLMKIPKREPSYFEFLNPLQPIVWVCTLGSFVVVSIVLYVLEKVGLRVKSPQQENRATITLRESFWFIFGSLLQGNTDSSPCTIPGRILTSAWWFFALILISSYTANLAAFLTVKKINTPIKSVTDLALQTKIKYGTVKDSAIMTFFKNTNIEHFAKMWAQMSEIDPDSMVDNTTQGYSKVKEGGYAFFWDTTVNKYQTIIDCDMMEIGPAFDPKGFGIGVPPGASYREKLSLAILKLSDMGKLHQLETKWWENSRCPDLTRASTEETSELQIENVAGVFFILVGGIIIAAIVCLGEYFGLAMLNASKLTVSKRAIDKREPSATPSSMLDPEEKDCFI